MLEWGVRQGLRGLCLQHHFLIREREETESLTKIQRILKMD